MIHQICKLKQKYVDADLVLARQDKDRTKVQGKISVLDELLNNLGVDSSKWKSHLDALPLEHDVTELLKYGRLSQDQFDQATVEQPLPHSFSSECAKFSMAYTVMVVSLEAVSDLQKGQVNLTDFPENKVLYKDSGLWQMFPEDESTIMHQGVNESDAEFIVRCKNEYS